MMWLQGSALTLLIVLARCQNVARLHFNASGQFKIAQFADRELISFIYDVFGL